MKRFVVLLALVLVWATGCATLGAPPVPPAPTATAGDISAPDAIVLKFTTAAGEETRSLRVTPDAKTKWEYGALKKTPSAVSVWIERNGALVPYGATSSAGGSALVDPNAFTIGPGDVLDVTVWKKPDLSREVPVRPDGRISLPLLGDVPAAGRTAGQLKETLAKEFSRFVANPEVTVIVSAINSYKVFVQGQVATPGTYPIDGKTTLVQAIALAGGFGQFAATGRIVIMRQTAKGSERLLADYDRIVGGRLPDVVLRPGDTIIVP